MGGTFLCKTRSMAPARVRRRSRRHRVTKVLEVEMEPAAGRYLRGPCRCLSFFGALLRFSSYLRRFQPLNQKAYNLVQNVFRQKKGCERKRGGAPFESVLALACERSCGGHVRGRGSREVQASFRRAEGQGERSGKAQWSTEGACLCSTGKDIFCAFVFPFVTT